MMRTNKAVLRMTRSNPREESLAPLIRELLVRLVEDPEREGLMRTPERVSQALRFFTSGYQMDIQKIVNGALYEVKYDEMVVVKDIEFFSLCEHHMLPFFGRMHVAYLPHSKIIGLSKIPRIVNAVARRLQIQERLTQEVAETMQQIISPLGVGVICEAKHFCMMMRGVEKQHSGAATSAMPRPIFQSVTGNPPVRYMSAKTRRKRFSMVRGSRKPGFYASGRPIRPALH